MLRGSMYSSVKVNLTSMVATGWLMTSRMHHELRQKQRTMTAMAVSILEDTYGHEPHVSRESDRDAGTRLRAASALGAAAMIGESIPGLDVMHVGSMDPPSHEACSHLKTALWGNSYN